MAEIKVSAACYNEIANALEATGRKLKQGEAIAIEKDDKIINPIDWRMVTLRRDVSDIACKVHPEANGFIDFTDELLQFILRGKLTGETPNKLPAIGTITDDVETNIPIWK